MDDTLFDYVITAAKSMTSVPTIYKYFDLETGLKAIDNQNIAFSRPDRFNDPFDCSVELLKIESASTRAHMAGAFARILKHNYSERYRLKRQLDRATDQQVEALAKRGLNFEYSHRGVTSFSTSFDEILMWAHYCKNHNGICIGYNNQGIYSFLRSRINEIGYLPIDYVDSLSKKSLYPVSDQAILYMLKTKSDIWKYEKEVRITGSNFSFNEHLLNFIKLDSDILSHLYIGINVDPDSTDKLLELAITCNPNIIVSQMRADYTAFNLTPKQLSP
ncbi:hypothetical protein AAKU52_003242 [Pedobacter sp. CG_S7]|uniref:DUF2971 domain-containing protein n=1 Tax=Pedobacter sp. CG_S7 TaxID=3143930 RepID=UPI003398822A